MFGTVRVSAPSVRYRGIDAQSIYNQFCRTENKFLRPVSRMSFDERSAYIKKKKLRQVTPSAFQCNSDTQIRFHSAKLICDGV